MISPHRALPRGDLSFLETQFPVSKMSIESYAERTAKQSQTLTGLGKWWGRKPLVVCRAAILGMLLPATNDPARDREVFLRLMTMDEDGLLRRRTSSIPAKELFRRLAPLERSKWFEAGSTGENAKLKKGLSADEKVALQRRVFLNLPYDQRLDYCARPEQVDGPSPESWEVINAHLGTNASSIPELVVELGKRRFGHVPRVGDSFCGGGSIPFEAARLGCEAFGSDLSPVAALLTWAALHIVGGGKKVVEEIRQAQHEVFGVVDRQVTEWGIEHREPDSKTGRRWRADAYLYCVEATCPECGWRVPMAPSWVIGKGTRAIARLVPDPKRKHFEFSIESGVAEKALKAAERAGTAQDAELVCPHCAQRTLIRAIRGDGLGTHSDANNRLRPWESRDVVPREGDIFGERLYCIRWVDTWTDKHGDEWYERHYLAPTTADLKREQRVLDLLMDRFDDWQRKGFIPSRRIEPGNKTDEPIRTRGWTDWHHLFTPRQLLLNGLFSEFSSNYRNEVAVGLLLMVGRIADWNSRLCRWNSNAANEKTEQTYSNQALNTLSNFGIRPLLALRTTWSIPLQASRATGKSITRACDGRSVEETCDLWVTDPPYADAVSYEEIGELFLSWYERRILKLFPGWYSDTKRALAVRGSDESFRKAMVDCYRRLAERMPNNGLQVVMFTHQDAGVWADLALILWAAGLRVTAAWCIATEIESALRQGNYVQGTVLLVLRKQIATESAFLDEIYQEVELEVRRQLDEMRDLDDASDPSFSDTDYQLAAYAAALRVLTAKKIEEIDVAYELTKVRGRGEVSPVEELIRRAVQIACDHLVPHGIETHLWGTFCAAERFYLKGLEMESHGERRSGVYQALARGFGVEGYTSSLASTKANETRLRTASEFGRREMGGEGFGSTVVRHALFAVCKTSETESPGEALVWLQTELPDYAGSRQRLIAVFDFFAALGGNALMPHWRKDAQAAGLLAGALRNREDNV